MKKLNRNIVREQFEKSISEFIEANNSGVSGRIDATLINKSQSPLTLSELKSLPISEKLFNVFTRLFVVVSNKYKKAKNANLKFYFYQKQDEEFTNIHIIGEVQSKKIEFIINLKNELLEIRINSDNLKKYKLNATNINNVTKLFLSKLDALEFYPNFEWSSVISDNDFDNKTQKEITQTENGNEEIKPNIVNKPNMTEAKMHDKFERGEILARMFKGSEEILKNYYDHTTEEQFYNLARFIRSGFTREELEKIYTYFKNKGNK